MVCAVTGAQRCWLPCIFLQKQLPTEIIACRMLGGAVDSGMREFDSLRLTLVRE